MWEDQRGGAEVLVVQVQSGGELLTFLCAVLGVTQNRKSHMGTVDTELVGTSRHRHKRQAAIAFHALQHSVLCMRRLSVLVYIT